MNDLPYIAALAMIAFALWLCVQLCEGAASDYADARQQARDQAADRGGA